MSKKIILFLIIIVFFVFGFLYLNSNEKKKYTQLTPITVRLKWIAQAQFAGYFVALENGYYRDAGLDVKIEPGTFGKNPLKTVGAGVEEFGIQWASDLIAESEEFISLANICKHNGFVLLSKKEKQISTPNDFVGKKIATWFIGHEYILKSLLKQAKILEKDLTLISQNWDMKQFYNNDLDVASAMRYNELLEVNKNGFTMDKLNIIDFNDYDLGLPGQNIFTTKAYFKENPALCKAFVKASIKGWEYTVNNPEKATDIVLKYTNGNISTREHQLEQLHVIASMIQAKKYPIGMHLKSDYNRIFRIFKQYNLIDSLRNVHADYTNAFIPTKPTKF